MIAEFIEVSVSKLRKAAWNYKEDNAEIAEKLAANIARNGQIENLIARELGDGTFEVINGNHRLDAMRLIGQEKAMICNLGKISDADAYRIAIETNETKFENDQDKLAVLIKEISEQFPLADLETTMPFSIEQLQGMKELACHSFEESDSNESEDKVTTNTTKLFITLSASQALIWGAFKEKNEIDNDLEALMLLLKLAGMK